MIDKWPSEKYTAFCKKQTEWQASLVRDAPLRYGNFAPLPLQNVQDTLDALSWCENDLSPKPEGYAITTSVNGKYLGNPYFNPIWVELNRLEAVLFIHPSETVMPSLPQDKFTFAVLEYPQETARTLMELVDEGTFVRFPKIRWIFCHNGGNFPFIFQRVIRNLTPQNLIGYGGPALMHKQVDRIRQSNNGLSLQELFAQSNIYFDSAQSTPAQHTILKSLGIKPSRLVSGSDLPFTIYGDDIEVLAGELHSAQDSGLYTPEEVEDVYHANALELFPRLKEEWGKTKLGTLSK